MIFEDCQYKYSLPPDVAQYTNVNFDTFTKEAVLIKALLIKNPVPENIKPMKILNDFVKDILKDENKQKDLDFDNSLEKIQGPDRSVMVPLSIIRLQLSQPEYPKRIQWRLTLKKLYESV